VRFPTLSDPVIDPRVRAFIQTGHFGGVVGYNDAEGVTLAPVAEMLGGCSAVTSCTVAAAADGTGWGTEEVSGAGSRTSTPNPW
jgi:hypothetical protein